ncbi:Transcription initiation factor TFIID subunit 12 [Striga hermonthica]|uniref:Transcription initiation factor TFIID subunit 12 n=1 Tax=Striga hermonthica TaxID=68872 RepID=A0A9N7R2B9_STRHE|nr:Transcription initiation factor TFIID subunit 12 [Striga hermonthica]
MQAMGITGTLGTASAMRPLHQLRPPAQPQRLRASLSSPSPSGQNFQGHSMHGAPSLGSSGSSPCSSQTQSPTQPWLSSGTQGKPPLPPPTFRPQAGPQSSQPSKTMSVDTDESSNRIVSKRSIQEIVNQIDPFEKLDPEVEDILVDFAEDFVESITTFGCSLAKHRKSTSLEAKDIMLHLERNWNITLPGFGGDEIKLYKNHKRDSQRKACCYKEVNFDTAEPTHVQLFQFQSRHHQFLPTTTSVTLSGTTEQGRQMSAAALPGNPAAPFPA